MNVNVKKPVDKSISRETKLKVKLTQNSVRMSEGLKLIQKSGYN